MKRHYWIGLLLGSGLLLNSCYKEDPTVAVIRIVDVDGNPVAGAEVHLFVTPTVPPPNAIILDETGTTDSGGEVKFNFTDRFNPGQAGFAVLSIEAQYNDILFGEGIVKIEEEKINSETVIVQEP